MIQIEYGISSDILGWMRLVQRVCGSFSGLETEEALTKHRRTVLDFMDRPITVTTYQEGVPEGIDARAFYKRMGFTEGKLTEEFGSPVQEFVWKAVGTMTGNVNCPCKKTKCERHGNCDACRAYHAGSKRKRPCERTKNRLK